MPMKHSYSKDSRLRRKLRRFPDALTEEIAEEMRESSEIIRRAIEAEAPRDEGDLGMAAHAVVSSDGLSAKIGYGNQAGFRNKWKKGGFVALFQEFGTRTMMANPWIRRLWRVHLPRVVDRIDARVNNVLRRASRGEF